MTVTIRDLSRIPKSGPEREAMLRALLAADLESMEATIIAAPASTVHELDALAYYAEQAALLVGGEDLAAATVARIPRAMAASEALNGTGTYPYCHACRRLSPTHHALGADLCAPCATGAEAIVNTRDALHAARDRHDALAVWACEETLERLHTDHRAVSGWLADRE